MGHAIYDPGQEDRPAWNVGRKLGAKRPLLPKQVWAVRFFLEQEHRLRDRALFDLAIDSKLRGCDLVKIKIDELVSGARIRQRAIVVQQKTGRPVQFELLEPARTSLLQWLERRGGALDEYVFPSRTDRLMHIGTRQYARLVGRMGHCHRPAPRGSRHSLAAAHKGSPDLQANWQSAGSADPTRSH